MEHKLGTIKVEAETVEETDEEITKFNDVKTRYGFLEYEPKEHVYALFLKGSNELIGDKLIGLGETDSAPLDEKDLVRTASLVNAAAVILVHNHPSGNPEATEQDIQATKRINSLLEKLGIELLDHVIISQNQAYSMKDHNQGPF